MPASMRLAHENDQQLRFSNPWSWGPVIALVGLLIWYLVPVQSKSGVAYWVIAGACGFAVFIGLMAFLWRDELTLDISSRTYTRARGYWPRLKTVTGSFSNLRQLLLTMELQTGAKGGQYPAWIIRLIFADTSSNIAIAQFLNEQQAYRKIEAWSKKMGVPAADSTSGREQALEEKSIAEQPPDLRPSSIPTLPVGSRIAFLDRGSSRTIVLPPAGLNAGVLILAFFPAIALWMGIAGYNDALRHIPPRSLAFPIGVICFGGLMVVGLCFAMFARGVVRDNGDSLLVGLRAFGWNYNVKTIAKRDIEDAEIRNTPASSGAPLVTGVGMRVSPARPVAARPELFIRSREQVVRIGQGLPAQDLEWLRQALLYIAAN